MWDVQKKSNQYFDSNAGAPLSRKTREGLCLFLQEEPELFCNPSSIHAFGRKAKSILRNTKDQIAENINADSKRILFTASGSEANQQAIRSWVSEMKTSSEPFVWITSHVEHDCVLELIPWVESEGGEVRFLPLLSSGAPDLTAVTKCLDGLPAARSLVSVIWVNNETGVMTPFCLDLLKMYRESGGKVHIDGAQAWGKIDIATSDVPWDVLCLAGHKIGALPGIGVLAYQSSFRVLPIVWGRQQSGLRGGTENVLGVLSLNLALKELDLASRNTYFSELKSRFESMLLTHFSDSVVIVGRDAPRVANTSSFYFTGYSKNQNFVQKLDALGFAVSSGSACAASIPEPSHVLRAMGVEPACAINFVRVSFALDNDINQVEALIQALIKVKK